MLDVAVVKQEEDETGAAADEMSPEVGVCGVVESDVLERDRRTLAGHRASPREGEGVLFVGRGDGGTERGVEFVGVETGIVREMAHACIQDAFRERLHKVVRHSFKTPMADTRLGFGQVRDAHTPRRWPT